MKDRKTISVEVELSLWKRFQILCIKKNIKIKEVIPPLIEKWVREEEEKE